MTRVVIRGFLFSQEIQQVEKVPQCLRRGVPKCVVLGCKQASGGNIFNFLGNGSNGFPTPNYTMYGSTKLAIKHLTNTLREEWQHTDVNLHTVSPGLMITDLLMENLSSSTFEYIKSMCSPPDLVAHHLVPRIRSTYYNCKNRESIKFLTLPKIIYKGICGQR